jgi:hypothetical protein
LAYAKSGPQTACGRLVHFIFDWLSTDPDLNDDIDVIRKVVADRNGIKAHKLSPL